MHEDVKQHQAKAGLPTMGGIVFLVTSVLVSLVLALLTNQLTNNVGMILFYSFCMVCWLDDFLKVFRKSMKGSTLKQSSLLQLVGGVIFLSLWKRRGCLKRIWLSIALRRSFLHFLCSLWLVGFSNAVNLTDGIDGLASISVVISLMESLLYVQTTDISSDGPWLVVFLASLSLTTSLK